METHDAPLRRTPLYDEHRRLGARIVPFAGWEMPVQYRGLVEEHRAVRTAVGLFDVSHMGEMFLSGEYAGQVLDYLVTSDLSKVAVGQAKYTAACNAEGTILDDLIVYRVARDTWLVVCNAGNRDKIAAHLAHAAENHCTFEDRSDATALIALQGPRALELLARAGEQAARAAALPSFHFTEAVVADVPATVARTGYTGEDGVELFCKATDAVALWTRLLELGRDLGIEPVGLGARDTLRLEARLSLYGNDIDETTHPLEAGLGWIVNLDKRDFVGKAALVAAKERGLARKLVGFEMTGRGIARHGYPIVAADGAPIGVCTSGGPSPTLGKSIGLGYVPAASSAIGTEILVDCRGKAVSAVIVKTPFYKRPTP